VIADLLELRVRVTEVKPEAEDVVSIKLRDAGGASLPAFSAVLAL
jgi:ferredoxin-NADP reductase